MTNIDKNINGITPEMTKETLEQINGGYYTLVEQYVCNNGSIIYRGEPILEMCKRRNDGGGIYCVIFTSTGCVFHITEEEFEQLKTNPGFQRFT